jgi:hypothetical protein
MTTLAENSQAWGEEADYDDDWGDEVETYDDWGPIEDSNPVDEVVASMEKKEFNFSKYSFDEHTFAEIKTEDPDENIPDNLGRQVSKLLQESVKDVKRMKGQREQRYVTEMVSTIYREGLFTFGGPRCPANVAVIRALRRVIFKCSKLEPKDPTRVSVLTDIAHSCQDCQPVQGRTILRCDSDMCNQSRTLDTQIQYFLLRQKEAAMHSFITMYHPGCDQDHTKVKPWEQRPHLFSAYMVLLGHEFGMDGIDVAKSDRFVDDAIREINQNCWRVEEKDMILKILKNQLEVKPFVTNLLADINNQSDNAIRMIDRDCIFDWVHKNMSLAEAHNVNYYEDRAIEFQHQDPKKPTDKNKYEPFLSLSYLIRILKKMRFLQ